MSPDTEGRERNIWLVALVGLALGLVMAMRIVAGADGDVTIFLAFGEDAVAITDHAEEILDQDVFTRISQGHDGKFFFLQSLDPLYLDPDTHSVHLDRPVYRGQRMLYPLLAGGFGLMPHAAIPWSMVLVNVLALGVGAWGTARYAMRMGASAWWGLAFPFNIGLLSEFSISGAGIVSFAAAVWAFVYLDEDRFVPATVMLTLSVLAREAMMLAVVGAIFVMWRRTGSWHWRLGAWPAAAAAVWAVYLRLRLEAGSGVDEVQEIGVPFGGIAGAFPRWVESPFDLLVAGVLVAILAAFAVRTVRSQDILAWGTVGFCLLAVLLTRQVWLRYFDISRAVAPAITGFVLLSFAARRVVRPDE